jgi:LacI family transcriptional regulator
VLIDSSNDDLRREREVVSAFSARRVDGLLVVPVGGNHRYLRQQMIAGTKVVCVDRSAENLAVDTVVVDNRNGAQHRAVLVVRGSGELSPEAVR